VCARGEVMIDPDSGRETWPIHRSASWARGLLRHAWLIPVSALLVAGFAYFVDGGKTPTYTAAGRIFLATETPVNGQSATDIARAGQTQAALITSSLVTREAATAVNLSSTELTGKVKADFATEASYITLSVTAGTAKDAALRAVAVERAYERVSLTQRQAQYLAVKDSLQGRLTTITADLSNVQKSLIATPSDPRLNAQLTSLTKQLADASDKMAAAGIAADSAGTGVGLFEPPDVPSAPTSPKPALAAVIGLALGGFLGALLAWLLPRIHERRAIPPLDIMGLRPLGELDGDGLGADSAADAALSVLLELPPGGQVMALLPAAGEPIAPQSALRLATALSAHGQSVVLVDGDSRRTLTTAVDARQGGGRDRFPPTEGLPPSDGSNSASLRLVPAGAPGASLWPSDVDALIGRLRKSYHLVVVVTGPLSKPDTRLLLSRSDIGLLVFDSRPDSIPPFDMASLHRVKTPVVGYIAGASGYSGWTNGAKLLGMRPVSASPSTFPNGNRELLTSRGQE
jgi:hypothetical protein